MVYKRILKAIFLWIIAISICACLCAVDSLPFDMFIGWAGINISLCCIASGLYTFDEIEKYSGAKWFEKQIFKTTKNYD